MVHYSKLVHRKSYICEQRWSLPEYSPLRDSTLRLATNIIWLKWLTVTIALAYTTATSIMAVKSFITQAYWAIFISLYFRRILHMGLIT